MKKNEKQENLKKYLFIERLFLICKAKAIEYEFLFLKLWQEYKWTGKWGKWTT